MKYFGLLVATGVLVCSMVSTVSAQTNDQVIDWMFENELTIYQTAEDFKLNQFVTRGEIAKFFNQYARTIGLEKKNDTSSCVFSDLSGYDETLVPNILEACEYGLVKGFEGKYFPNSLITEAEAITVVIRSILGLQDETTDPWRSETATKAMNLGILQQTTMDALDVSATRGTIGNRLYTVANEYIPATEDTQPDDVYTSQVVGDSDSGGVRVTFFDGTSTQIVTNVPFQQNNFASVQTYQTTDMSPDGKFIALNGRGFEEPFVEFYDIQAKSLTPRAYGSFQDRTSAGFARLQRCYKSTGQCDVRRSISPDSPWIFPEVWAEGGNLGFVCQDSDQFIAGQSINYKQQLSLNLAGELSPLKIIDICRGLFTNDYEDYSIPDEALLGLSSMTAGLEEYFYVITAGDKYEVYTSGPRNKTETTQYEYTLLETFSM